MQSRQRDRQLARDVLQAEDRSCRAAFDEWTGLLRAAFVGAGMAEPRAQALAFFAVSTIEGLLVLARAYRDCSALGAVAVELEAAVAAALPGRARSRKKR